MTSRTDMHHAAELLGRLMPTATPAPWRDSSVDGNQYRALVSDTCTRQCDDYAARHADLEWMGHPHDGYGGCLVAESQTAADRRLMAVLRNVADHLGPLLEAVADEDPIEVGRLARTITDAVLDTHRPRHSTVTRSTPNTSPTSDTSTSPTSDTFPCG